MLMKLCYYSETYAMKSNKKSKSNESQLVYSIGSSLYINICNRCTLECKFCPKTQGNMALHQYDLSLNKQPSAQEIIEQLDNLANYQEVVFCGFGEPTLRLKQLKEVASFLKKAGKKVRLNTDGLGNLVHKRNILPELSSIIDSVSISLNSDNENSYIEHCQPKLQNAYKAVLAFITQAPFFIKEVRVTAIEGLSNVDIDNCRSIAHSVGAQFLARQLDVVG